MRFTLFLVTILVAACNDGGTKRPIGSACDFDSQCDSGICGGGVCLDPEVDTDGDTLINRVEASLRTDPVRTDSDGDGVSDSGEVGSVASPVDTDGDGKIDAIESSTADADSDCITDQLDPDDGLRNTASEAFPNACGDGTRIVTCGGVSGGISKSCVAPLISALHCFDPGGCYAPAIDDNVTLATWENGARIDLVGEVFSYVASSGSTCFSIDSGTSNDVVASYTLGDGRSYQISVSTAGSVQVICPSGSRSTITAADAAAMQACSTYFTTWSACEVPTPQ